MWPEMARQMEALTTTAMVKMIKNMQRMDLAHYQREYVLLTCRLGLSDFQMTCSVEPLVHLDFAINLKTPPVAALQIQTQSLTQLADPARVALPEVDWLL